VTFRVATFSVAFRRRRGSVSSSTLGRRSRARPVGSPVQARACRSSRSTNDVHAAGGDRRLREGLSLPFGASSKNLALGLPSPIQRARPPSEGSCNRDRPDDWSPGVLRAWARNIGRTCRRRLRRSGPVAVPASAANLTPVLMCFPSSREVCRLTSVDSRRAPSAISVEQSGRGDGGPWNQI
jgi:hypothetical protein